LLLALSGVFGCQLVFDFDGSNPGDPPPDGDIPATCTSDPDCNGLLCEDNRCVECTADRAEACTGTAPVCGDDQTCRGCVGHTDCASEACLPDGSCAPEADVAYVEAGGGTGACTKSDPCSMTGALGTIQPVIKIKGLVEEMAEIRIQGRVLTIVAEPGAALDRLVNGPLLTISGVGTDVTIVDLTITGQTGGNDFALTLAANGGDPRLTLTRVTLTDNQGGAILASAGTLTVSQSTISSNQGGGIFISGSTEFVITNNFVFRNGNPDTGTYGGVNLGVASVGSNRFEFNTVTDNRAATNAGGVACNIPQFVAPNNIIARNFLAGLPTTQTFGACMYPSSIVQDDLVGLAFVQPGIAPFDYHLGPGSAAIDAATTDSPITVDVDGDGRGTMKDVGADELP
jgi:parallel beta-helix repeat protein